MNQWLNKHNLKIFPIVILIRVPIMLVLWVLSDIGDYAKKLGNKLNYKLPSFKKN